MAGAVVEAESAINEGQGIPKPQLDVTARPVDTYISPVNPDRTALGQLANSLKDLNPVLGKVAERFQEQEAKEGATQGAEAFQETHGDYAQAIQKGLLPHVFSPYARIASRETFGRLGAEKFHSDMWSDPDFNKAIDGATTIQAFDQATQAFQSKWDSTNLGHVSHSDSAFQNAFQTMRQAHLMDDRTKFADQVNKNFVGMTSENFQADQSAALRNAVEDGSFLKDPSRIAGILSAQAASYTSKGFSPRLATAANAAALSQLAEDVGAGRVGDGSVTAQDIFNLAKQIPGSKDKSLYDDSEYMGKLRTQTLDKLTQEQRVKYQVDRLRDAEETKETIHDTYSSMYEDATKGDLKSMNVYRDQLASVSDVEARRIPKIYEALHGDTWQTQESVDANLTHAIGLHTDPHDPDYVTRQNIEDALLNHTLTPERALTLLKAVTARDNPKGKQYDPLHDSDWQEFKATAGATLLMTGDKMDDKVTAGKVNLELSRKWEEFMEENPAATRKEKGAFLDAAYTQAVKKWAPPGDWTQFFQGTGTSIQHSGTADYVHDRVLPEGIVDEASLAIEANHKTGKPIPAEMLETLKAWGLTDGPSIIRAIRAQKALYEPPATDKVEP